MRQVGHIFKKDLRHLWPASFLVLALTAIFAWMNARNQALSAEYFFSPHMQLLPLLLPIGWWYLIAAVVGQETLPGEDQFWVTRPYSRLGLAAAKILYIVMFINLPMLITDCVILHGQGFPIAPHVAGLLFKQLMLSALWLFPAMALAAICRNVWQFLGAGLIIVVSYVLPNLFGVTVPATYWGGIEWIRACIFLTVLGAVSLLILICQYRQRRTALARLAGVCGLVLAFTLPYLPSQSVLWNWQFAMSPLPSSPSVQIAFDPARSLPSGLLNVSNSDSAQLDFPLHVTGIPDGTELWADSVSVAIETQDGTLWKNTIPSQILSAPDARYAQKTWVDRAVFERLKDQPVTLHVSTHLTLTRNPRTTPLFLQNALQDVPDWGRCTFQAVHNDLRLRCWSPFRRPAVWAAHMFGSTSKPPPTNFDSPYRYLEAGSYFPLPAQAGISPLVVTSTSSGSGYTAMAITTEKPVAQARSDFEIRSVRLADYLVH